MFDNTYHVNIVIDYNFVALKLCKTYCWSYHFVGRHHLDVTLDQKIDIMNKKNINILQKRNQNTRVKDGKVLVITVLDIYIC